ncbi:protein kinase domain-containing protein, partial [Streptomyces sp. CBMA29]|uniref:protein kinase domain-containing protein n=1 Tax=Streptomyces sp. CBMA29 TaxID=1896314 RepID=UPI00397F6FA5
MGAQHFQPLTAEDPTGVPGYRISARLGGRVYLAHAPGGIPVALRLIDRFPPDVHALRQVHGPCVVPFVDGGADAPGAGPWLATAYVPGLSLRTAVTTTGPLPVPSVLRLVAGIAEALRTIHHCGLTHAALTPAHVLLAADGPRVKDFALTGVADTSAAQGSPAEAPAPVSLTGEPVADEPPAAEAFLAPEQVAGKTGGPAADVFSLGLIAAYAAVGGAAVGGGEADLNELPGELREIVTRCLIKDPALRPSPAQIIAMCAQAAPDASRRRADRW